MHTGDFNWALIPSFLAALDRGSLMAAARTLDTSQPTVGRHIGELEAQLGVVLFERTGRGLVPTAHAHRLAEAARSMSGAADQLARQASGAQLEARGTVRISASQPVTCVLLPPLLRQMRELHPDIQIELVSSNAVSNLLQREADIALRMVRPDQSSLVAKRVGRVTIGTFAHRDYLRRRGTPRVPTDLLVHDLVGNDRNTDILRGFAAMGFPLQREDFAVRTDDLNAYQAAVTSGLGVGFLARYAVRENPELVPLLPMLDIPPLP
ncbi:LysR family transcriptional regulator, partial [Hydrogenophaga sp.]